MHRDEQEVPVYSVFIQNFRPHLQKGFVNVRQQGKQALPVWRIFRETAIVEERTSGGKEMTDQELQSLVEDISTRFFGVPFRHQARFNSRLRTTGGRYLLHTHDIEINPRHLEEHGETELVAIVKHELCHYHLHLMNRGYRHRDRDFMELLAKVGGSRYCRHLPGSRPRVTKPPRYMLKCVSCGTEYLRKRRMDPRRYACGNCGGKLRLFMLSIVCENVTLTRL